jgi:nucleoside-diphosphate-sugar epimerase
MALKVVVGAGGTGVATAELLAGAGEDVRLITRRGSGPTHPRIHRIALDATDSRQLVDAVNGAETLFNCAAPPYHLWSSQFAPLAASLLKAAIATGVDYVMLGNLYGYGPVEGPMTENLPMRPNSVKGRIRAQAWADAQAAHDAGRVRVTEVRASDFIGRGAMSVFTLMVAPKVLAAKPALFPADLDAPHSWTGTIDAARALIAVGSAERTWGGGWHAPTNPAVSPRQLAITLARCAGVREPRLRRMPGWLLTAAGLPSPAVRELPEMQYQLQKPFVVDSSRTERELGLSPTPLADIVREGLADTSTSIASARGTTSS